MLDAVSQLESGRQAIPYDASDNRNAARILFLLKKAKGLERVVVGIGNELDSFGDQVEALYGSLSAVDAHRVDPRVDNRLIGVDEGIGSMGKAAVHRFPFDSQEKAVRMIAQYRGGDRALIVDWDHFEGSSCCDGAVERSRGVRSVPRLRSSQNLLCVTFFVAKEIVDGQLFECVDDGLEVRFPWNGDSRFPG